MTTFTIFGSGAMGTALAGVLGEAGASAQHVGRTDEGTTLTGDVVILAVPHPALRDITARYGEQLAGRIVVDITNPLDFETFDALTVPAGSSAAEQLAAALPGARVLKAFNTNFAATLASKEVGGHRTSVLIAGDDADAKAVLAAAVTAGGLDALDAGSLRRAHELEAIGFLQLTLAAGERIGWSGGFALAR